MARGLRTGVAALTSALVVALAACSWGGEEPGLFSTPGAPMTAPTAPAPDRPPDPTDPRLPVVGEALWTTADGGGVTVRLAVHAVRRTAGATVLDWSVTPLAGPGRRAGELVPSGTDLGLTRTLAGEQDLTLLDVGSQQAYRPLADVSRQRFSRCLCTPLFAITPELRFGRTALLQLAFPVLAPGTFQVDVVLPNVAVLAGVPVTPAGGTPVADGPTDLTRPAVVGNPVTGAQTITTPGAAGRQQTVVVNQVVASRGLTSVVWTLHSVDDQGGLGSTPGPPVSSPERTEARVVPSNPASGPRLRVIGGRQGPVGVRWTTASFAGRPAYECLCSALGLWSRALRYGGGSAHLATHVGPLPEGTRRVDVLFPGLPPFTDVRVTWREDAAGDVQTVEPGTDATWTYDEADPPRGWTTQDWPTPLPDPAQLAGYASRPERVLDALPRS